MYFYLRWRKEIEEADLYKVMKAYWHVFHGSGLYRDEQLFLLQRNIKKRLQKRILSSKVWFFEVTKKKIQFNPRAYEGKEKLLIRKDKKLKKYLIKYPQLTRKAKRHKKVPEYLRPLGFFFFLM